jgi:hypothetical protein
MGIDGGQTLEIRGPEAIIKQIEECGAALNEGNEEILYIATRFFGKAANVKHRSERYIVFSYEFRNYPINEYLVELLAAYPQCWMKNEFRTEIGHCGMWIGRFRGEEPDIQELSWRELDNDEYFMVEDFQTGKQIK